MLLLRMLISSTEFNRHCVELYYLLRDNLTDYIRGLCRKEGIDAHIAMSISVHELLIIDFFIFYDKFYSVPVCYFNARDVNGNFFDLDGFVSHCQKLCVKIENIQTLSQDINPITKTVSFYIHPCEANSTLSNWNGIENTIKYLSIWFNLYGLPTIIPSTTLRPLSIIT